MTSFKRFLLGGGGALMPVLVSLLAIDIGATLDTETSLTTGNLIGFGIRYLILFILGGVVAYLHEEEHKPFKLFELGIAAPALITSLITAQGIAANSIPPVSSGTSFHFSIISSAYADTDRDVAKEITVAWGLADILDGVSGRAYQRVGKAAQDTGKATDRKITPDSNKILSNTKEKNVRENIGD